MWYPVIFMKKKASVYVVKICMEINYVYVACNVLSAASFTVTYLYKTERWIKTPLKKMVPLYEV